MALYFLGRTYCVTSQHLAQHNSQQRAWRQAAAPAQSLMLISAISLHHHHELRFRRRLHEIVLSGTSQERRCSRVDPWLVPIEINRTNWAVLQVAPVNSVRTEPAVLVRSFDSLSQHSFSRGWQRQYRFGSNCKVFVEDSHSC